MFPYIFVVFIWIVYIFFFKYANENPNCKQGTFHEEKWPFKSIVWSLTYSLCNLLTPCYMFLLVDKVEAPRHIFQLVSRIEKKVSYSPSAFSQSWFLVYGCIFRYFCLYLQNNMPSCLFACVGDSSIILLFFLNQNLSLKHSVWYHTGIKSSKWRTKAFRQVY